MRSIDGAETATAVEAADDGEVVTGRLLDDVPAPTSMLMVLLRCMLRELIVKASEASTTSEVRDYVAAARDTLRLLRELAAAYDAFGEERIGA